MNRVVITGIGALSPLGNTFKECWEAAKAGKSGVGLITKCDTSDIPWKVAGELINFKAEKYLSQQEIQRLDPFVLYAVAASFMAADDAGLLQKSEVEKGSLIETHGYLNYGGVIIGSSRGGISSIEQAIVKKLHSGFGNRKSKNKKQKSRVSPFLMPATTISMASSYSAQKLGIKGYCLGVSNACASGTNAIGYAYNLIRAGYKGPVLAGGSEAPLCRVCIEGYGVSGALSKNTDLSASRPFDRIRDGFVLSEGACVLVLEDYKSALKRNAKIYCEIVGYGNTTDAFHMTRPDPKGEAEAMIKAISESGITPGTIDYINTHGTSTPVGDSAETKAIQIVFRKRASEISVTASKSMTGHMLSASGALETALTAMTIKQGIIPPTINLSERDPACNLNIITQKKHADINIAISNSFGFGGINAVLILQRL